MEDLRVAVVFQNQTYIRRIYSRESALGVAGEEFVLQKFLRMADIGKYISVAALV